jgi:ABC-type lipoprotein export system ATPase subunit
MARENIIEVEAVSKDFQLGEEWVHALREVDVTIREGEFVAIMGPSGSGKSTLLYAMGGLDRINSGRISVNGYPLDQMSGEALAEYRRETIGFIFQAFHLVPSLTALENVALPGIFANMERNEREIRAYDLLDKLGMGDRINHKPTQLSGGQQQRVAIARSLFNDPPIIMADEPTGALDSETGKTVMTLLRTLSNKERKTIIVVTHDPGVAAYADRLIKLQDGRIIEDQATNRLSRPTSKVLIQRVNGWEPVEQAIAEEWIP